jgi:hypothetical protein
MSVQREPVMPSSASMSQLRRDADLGPGPILEILRQDGSVERHSLGRDRVILGRQPRDGIAVPYALELEAEHLLLAPRSEGCWLSVAEGVRTPALVRGQRFDGGLVPWGTELSVGSLWLKLVASRPRPARPPAVSLPTLGFIVALLGVAGWLLFSPEEEELPGMTTAQPPALFGDAPGCPEKDEAATAPRAREAADAALAKSQRYPFAAQDGIRAVEMFGEAASCFAAAGQDAAADRVRKSRTALEARIQEDYRTHRLKLERAIEYRRTRAALVEVRELLALVRHLDHPYTTWLHTLERHLSLKTESD